ncbi:MAG: TonB-dependent receptor plug domain-containing protein [Ignavibacteriae bacterium]|nr:TonB-dependent receptor plug domain-containing protein [Ignavibacteriota bacterium]
MKAFKSKIVIVLLSAICTLSNAQDQKVNISGWVTDAVTGDFLIGSNILLYKDSLSLNSQPLKGAASNNVGFYVLSKIPKGKYVIVIRNIGYKTLAAEINNTIEQGSLRYNAKLIPEDVKLEEIVVEDKKAEESKISTIEVSRELLDQLPSLGGETPIFKALEMLPGIKTASELSSGLYVRGGSPDQTLTLLDGVIIYNPAHLGNFSSTFNSSALQSVKLIKGAFPAEYGGRLSSVLDIKLRSGTQEKDKRNLTLGSISSSVMLEGPLNENLTYMISGRSMYYDFYQKQFNKNSNLPRYNYYDLSGKMTFNISENNILSVAGLYNKDNVYSPGTSSDINYDIGWQNSALSFNWFTINEKSLLINTIVSFVDYKSSSILNTEKNSAANSNYYSSSVLNDIIIKTNVESNIEENHKIKAGVELAIHNYDLIYSDFYSELIENNPNVEQYSAASEFALFIQDEWEIFPFWKANIGGRFYYFKSKEFFRFEPRVSTSFYPTEYLQLNLAYAKAHQFLHLIVRNDISLPTDLWYPSSEKITPSESDQVVAGIDAYLNNRMYKVSVEAYYKRMNSIYEFKNSSTIQIGESLDNQFTEGKGESYGMEIFLNKKDGQLTGWIGYTLSWTRRQFDELNTGRVFYPRYDRRHDISLVLGYSFSPKLSFGITWKFASGQGLTLPTGQYQLYGDNLISNSGLQFNYTNRNDFRLSSYHKMDVNIAYNFELLNLPGTLYLNVFNVYNKSNPFAVYINLKEENGKKFPVLKQLTLFPIIPTVGIKLQF